MTIYNIKYTNNTQQATAISIIYFFFLLQATDRLWHLANPSHIWDAEIGIADAVRIAGRFWKQ